MHARKIGLMMLVGCFLVSCTAAVAQVSGPLSSVDKKRACIEAPNPSDERAVQCFPLEDGVEIKEGMYQIGSLVTLRIQRGKIISIEKIGAPTG